MPREARRVVSLQNAMPYSRRRIAYAAMRIPSSRRSTVSIEQYDALTCSSLLGCRAVTSSHRVVASFHFANASRHHGVGSSHHDVASLARGRGRWLRRVLMSELEVRRS